MLDLPDPDWYFDNVLIDACPGGRASVIGPAVEWRQWWAAQLDRAVPLNRLAARQGFVVTTAQLREFGWREHDLRREVRRGNWSIPSYGAASPIVVTGSDLPALRRRHALAGAARTRTQRDSFATGLTAAIQHGLPTMVVPSRAEVAGARSSAGRDAGTHVRAAGLSPTETTTWFGSPVTTVARTVIDLARHDRRDGIMAADAALHESLATPASLAAAVTRAAGWPGIQQARDIIAIADHRAESPLESITRLALHDDGFPMPRPQVKIADPRRAEPWRVDLLWDQYRLILECDGRVKYADDDERWREKRRETRLRALGWQVERVIWEDVVRYWPQTSARLLPFFRLPPQDRQIRP